MYPHYPQSVNDVWFKAANIPGSIQAKLYRWKKKKKKKKNEKNNFTAEALTKEVHKISVV